jgi:hypothetical protein
VYWKVVMINSNMTSFFRFVNKWTIYQLAIISLAHALVHVTDFPIINVDELSSARIWQHKLCATLSAHVNINYCLPIKVYYRICTLRHIRIEIIHYFLKENETNWWFGVLQNLEFLSIMTEFQKLYYCFDAVKLNR